MNKMKMKVYQAAMQDTSDDDEEGEQDDTYSEGESSAGDSEFS
jgi:hypothetical protein